MTFRGHSSWVAPLLELGAAGTLLWTATGPAWATATSISAHESVVYSLHGTFQPPTIVVLASLAALCVVLGAKERFGALVWVNLTSAVASAGVAIYLALQCIAVANSVVVQDVSASYVTSYSAAAAIGVGSAVAMIACAVVLTKRYRVQVRLLRSRGAADDGTAAAGPVDQNVDTPQGGDSPTG